MFRQENAEPSTPLYFSWLSSRFHSRPGGSLEPVTMGIWQILLNLPTVYGKIVRKCRNGAEMKYEIYKKWSAK